MAESIGVRLRHLRISAGHTQTSLGRLIGYAPGTLCNWERARCTPPLEALLIFSDTYGVSMDYLIAGRGSHDGRVLIGGPA